jgi:hypothetical protein
VVGVARNQKTFQMPRDNVIPDPNIVVNFDFSEVYYPCQSENALSSEQSDTPHHPANLRSLDEISDTPPKREAVNVLEAMKMESAFVDCLKEKEAMHHSNYHVIFEEGALEPLM